MRFILTTLSETSAALEELRDVCESRATICPGLVAADPAEKRQEEERRRQTWVIWGAGRTTLERLILPMVLVMLTIVLTRVFG